MVDALRTTTAASASGLIKTAGFRRVFFVATARSGLPMGARRMATYRRAGALFGSDRQNSSMDLYGRSRLAIAGDQIDA